MTLYLLTIMDDVVIMRAIQVIVDIVAPNKFASIPESVVPAINNPKLETCSPESLPL